MVTDHAVKAGYNVTREQHLQPHYVKTLDTWAANLEAKKDEAIAITSEQIYERFLQVPRPAAPTCSARATPTSSNSLARRA